MAFSFGNGGAGATPAAAASSISFGNLGTPGAAPAAPSAPATTTTTGFGGFGGAASATTTAPVPASATTTTTTGFGVFGGTATGGQTVPGTAGTTALTTTTNAASSFGAPSTTTALVSGAQPNLTAPDFDSTFENVDVWNQIRKLCNETTTTATNTADQQQYNDDEHTRGDAPLSLAGQDLTYFVSTHATTKLKPLVVEWTPQNQNESLRQQLAQNPLVGLNNGTATTTTNLTPKTLERVSLLASDLRIPIAHAITLYAQVSSDYDILNSMLTSNTVDGGCGFIDQALPNVKYDPVTKLARDFYFYERHLKLETILYLIEQRLQNNPNVIRATDSLLEEGQLVNTLITVIREYTERVRLLQQEITTSKNGSDTSMMGMMGGEFSGGPQYQQQQQQQQQQHQHQHQQQRPTSNFAEVHLLFCNQERQTAAEALVFIAYHTQLEVNELSAMIDLIRDLSAGTPKLSPFKDVPSPYESSSDSNYNMTNPYHSYGGGGGATGMNHQYPWERKEKDPLKWQEELVQQMCESGRPKLLQCYSILVVAAMAAMETRQVLFDRKLHGPNDFGMGNQMLHPARPSIENIKELHARLKPQAHEQWARPDIWGLLACSYALLLRPTASVIASPAKGGSTSPLSKEVREAARYCIIVPAQLMSFTFCRLTLIPSLEKIKSASMRTVCNVSEFCLSVVSEVYSLYLSVLSEGTGNLPISRRRWQIREEEQLKLRRDQMNQQRQFEQYMGNTSRNASSKEGTIPAGIDLMERIECLDDLIALATTLCSLGTNYSRMFWGKDKENKSLAPSSALQECVVQASQDDSLIAYVFSWMASLSMDEESASAIHHLMSNNLEGFTSWNYLLYNLRWIARDLSNNDGNKVSKPSPTTANSSKSSTSYYYNLEGNVIPDTSNDSQSRGGGGRNSTSSSSKSPKSQELSELMKLQVASYLALMMNVSLHSVEARFKILSIDVPDNDGNIVTGGERCLCILFNLAIAPLVPQIRGATLSTIASLLQSTEGIEDPEVKSYLEEQGKNAWEYLECSSLLPINLLDRYRVVKTSGLETQSQVGLSFPPSSMTLASSSSYMESTIHKHPMYGLLYEMDHIESKKGWYPSTEGFLDLLKSLVSSVGCPSNLGQNSRVRTGCTPYVEYIIHFVLPKALGVNSQASLPFRVSGDRSRLVSRALAVVEAVITRYNLPSADLRNTKAVVTPLSILGIQTAVDQVHVTSNQTDAKEIADDFKSMTASDLVPPSDPFGSNPTSTPLTANANQYLDVSGSSATGIPVPKSPGFTVLVELLSSSCGILLQSLAVILTECGGPSGVLSIFGDQSDKMDMTYALYCSTPPDLNSAKEGSKENGPTKPLQNLLKSFSPKFQTANIDDKYVDNSIMWRETSIASALHILCAAAIREDAFIDALAAAKDKPLKLFPVLQFQELLHGSGNGNAQIMDMKAKDVQVSRLTDLLFSIRDSRFLRSTIVQYVGYDAVYEMDSSEIAAAALSIVYRMKQTMSPLTSLRSLSGDESDTSGFSKSFASRLLISSKKTDSSVRDSQVLTLILNWILSELRSGGVINDGLAQVLLGLPSETNDGNWNPGRGHYSGAVSDCFDAILDILDHRECTSIGVSDISSLCFEIFFRLHDLIKSRNSKSLKIAIYTAKRLRDVDFWKMNVSKMLFVDLGSLDQEQFIQTVHSLGWLLKGVSCELRLLVGFASDVISASGFARLLEPHPKVCDLLLSSLFGSDASAVYTLVKNLPLELVSMDPNLPHPSQEVLRASVCDLSGAQDVVQGYQILDSNKAVSIIGRTGTPAGSDDAKNVMKWIKEWNFIARRNCAVSHLTNSINVLIDASLYSAQSMSLYREDLLDSSSFSHPWLHNDGLRDVLVWFLLRLDFSSNMSDHQGMDGFLLPVATRNLSNIVLTLSESATSPSSEGSISSSDLLQIGALVARIIESSSIGQDTAEEAPFRYERTATLGSALALLLRSSASLEPEFAKQYQDDFIRAAHGLARISRFKVDSTDNDSRGIVSMLSRGCIASIVLALCHDECDDDSMIENSYACSCIPQEFLEQLIILVAELDEDVCNFLQVIALKPSGAKMLIDAGIDQALLSAAKQYMKQETDVIKNLDSSSFTKSTIRTPGFLLSHLKLICALLTTAKLPEQSANSFSLNCIEIIATYRPTIDRLCYNFPVQADFLRCFLKALNLVFSFAKPIKKRFQGNTINNSGPNFKEIISRAGFLENGIIMLLEQLSENPLPRDMLPERMPKELKESTGLAVSSNIVSVEKDNSSTWWDVLQQILTTRHGDGGTSKFLAPTGDQVFNPARSWNVDTFEYSIVASDILCLGLNLLKRMERTELLNGSDLARGRGLFRTFLAAKSVGDRLEHVRLKTTNTIHSMETDDNLGNNTELEFEYLELLGKSLASCVEQLLILCLQVCDSDLKENGQELVLKQIGIAIEASGIDNSSLLILSEERQEFIKILCEEIKNGCKGI
jgi:hypothetical protein